MNHAFNSISREFDAGQCSDITRGQPLPIVKPEDTARPGVRPRLQNFVDFAEQDAALNVCRFVADRVIV
jgi:hypothetical protein